ERVFVLPPGSQIGPITPEQRNALMSSSLVAGVYEKMVDRESAYEKLKGRAAASGADGAAPGSGDGARSSPTPTAGPAPGDAGGGVLGGLKDVLFGTTGPR